MNHDETTARQSAGESIANEVDAARAERDDYQRRYRNQMIAARDLVDKLAAAEAERDALKAAVERTLAVAHHPRTSQGLIKNYVPAADVIAALEVRP